MTKQRRGSTTERLREIVLAVPHGQLLPAERALAEQLGVARMTVRNAIDALAREGLVRTRPGVGTERIPTPVGLSVSLRSFAEIVREHGMHPDSDVLHLARDTERPPEVSRHLGIGDDVPVMHLRRVRLGDDQPLALEETWLSPELIPELDELTAAGSLYELFAGRDLAPTDGVELVTAGLPNADEIEALDLTPALPVLRLVRKAFAKGRPLEYATVTFPADRYELSFPLTR